MTHSQSIARSLALLGIAFGAFACDATTDPFTIGPGHASVMGKVTTSTGAPVPSTTIRISCPGVSEVVIPVDTAGSYAANLTTSEPALQVGAGEVSCRFAEPAVGFPRVQVNARLGFARGPVLVPLQMVDLHEQ